MLSHSAAEPKVTVTRPLKVEETEHLEQDLLNWSAAREADVDLWQAVAEEATARSSEDSAGGAYSGDDGGGGDEATGLRYDIGEQNPFPRPPLFQSRIAVFEPDTPSLEGCQHYLRIRTSKAS